MITDDTFALLQKAERGETILPDHETTPLVEAMIAKGWLRFDPADEAAGPVITEAGREARWAETQLRLTPGARP